MEYGYIYIIKNKINNKVYIGQTLRSAEERFKQHMKPSNNKKSYKIYRAINKYGSENFYYEILEENVNENIINEREIYWIDLYDSFKNGYNSNVGGFGRSIFKRLDVDYIINELKSGKSVKKLSEEFHVNTHTINRTLKRYGINNIKDIQNRSKVLSDSQKKADRDEVKKLCYEGYSVSEIAGIMKCNVKTIRRIKHELNINMDRPRYDYSNINDADIIKDKLSGLKVKFILSKHNISYGYYYIIWKEYQNTIQKENSNDYPEKE